MDASTHALNKVHPDWLNLFPQDFAELNQKLSDLKIFTPSITEVFKVFETPPGKVKVVIVGQDPYPTAGDATGLAFSVLRDRKLPKSLINIFMELESDLGTKRISGDLSDWQEQGIFLLNRILTAPIGNSMGHRNFGWQEFTEKVIKYLGQQGAVGLLMGKEAASVAHYFSKSVVTVHPSPLSAHKGFFGSKPFSQINSLLDKPIRW